MEVRRLRLAVAVSTALHSLHSLPTRKQTECELRHFNSSQANDARWYKEQAEHIALRLSLVDEAKAGWWHEVTRRYRQGEAVDQSDSEGNTLLHLAAKHGKRRIVEELVSLGAPYRRDMQGRTPLLSAASSGHSSVATTLLATGVADINESDSTGATALLLAAQAGHVKVGRFLPLTLHASSLQPCPYLPRWPRSASSWLRSCGHSGARSAASSPHSLHRIALPQLARALVLHPDLNPNQPDNYGAMPRLASSCARALHYDAIIFQAWHHCTRL